MRFIAHITYTTLLLETLTLSFYHFIWIQ